MIRTPSWPPKISDCLHKHLDRDVAIQLRIARAIDLAHSPSAEGGEDFVRTDATAGEQGQMGGHSLWVSACHDLAEFDKKTEEEPDQRGC